VVVEPRAPQDVRISDRANFSIELKNVLAAYTSVHQHFLRIPNALTVGCEGVARYMTADQ